MHPLTCQPSGMQVQHRQEPFKSPPRVGGEVRSRHCHGVEPTGCLLMMCTHFHCVHIAYVCVYCDVCVYVYIYIFMYLRACIITYTHTMHIQMHACTGREGRRALLALGIQMHLNVG